MLKKTVNTTPVSSRRNTLITCIGEESQGSEPYIRSGSSNSCYSGHGSKRTQEQLITPNKRAQKRKTLEDVNVHFIEAANSFKAMCAGVYKQENDPTEDELFGQRVVAFISAITNEEDKNSAKAGVLKYLADCVSAQFE